MTRQEALALIDSPNSSGQGYSETHKSSVFHSTIISHGYQYSHPYLTAKAKRYPELRRS